MLINLFGSLGRQAAYAVADLARMPVRGRKTRAHPRPALKRLFVMAAIAVVLGVAIGVLLGGKHRPFFVAHKAPATIEAVKPDAKPPGPGVAVGPNIVAIPLEPPRGGTEQPPGTLPEPIPPPRLITSHEDPRVVYEEAVPEPAPMKPEHPAPGGDRDMKPVLLANLANFAEKPIEGPKPLWLQNARTIPDTHGLPIIALVIDDVGLDRKRAERAMHLPAPVTLSFMTYAPEVSSQAREAIALGHEIMVHFPMEPDNPRLDPGPHALRVSENAAEIERNLAWGLGQFSGYVAVNNHMGSKFTRDPDGMRIVMQELKARGLFFLDSRTTPSTVGPSIAREVGLPHLDRDVFLDNIDTREEVSARLAELERTARHYGYAIAIGHPRDATLGALERWTSEVQSRGLALVPISAVMRLRLTGGGMKVSG